LAILLAVHLARATTEPLQHVSDKYRLTESDQQEDLATLGSVQLRQTLALSTLASRLPGERPLLETNGDILWTQQCSSGVRSERRNLKRPRKNAQKCKENTKKETQKTNLNSSGCLSYDDCMEYKRENYQNCPVLYIVIFISCNEYLR